MRICLLSYRGYKYSGGQGIYVRYLSSSLQKLGHEVDVLAGPPYPDLVEGINLVKLPSLDLYRLSEPRRLFINPLWLNTWPNFVEWVGECGAQLQPLVNALADELRRHVARRSLRVAAGEPGRA